MDLAHPLCVARREVVVHGYNVNAAPARQRIQVSRQSGDESFTFTRAHLRDLALMQNDAADHLHVEMAHAGRTDTSLSNHGKRFRKDLIEHGALATLSLFLVSRVTN